MLKNCILAAAIGASPAFSQELTREGAQQFLKEIAGEGKSSFAIDVGLGFNAVRQRSGDTSTYIYTFPPAQILDAKSDSVCETFFRMPDSAFKSYYDGGGWGDSLHPIILTTGVTSYATSDSSFVRVVWTQIAQTKVSGNFAEVSYNPDFRFRFILPSESLAKRAGFAMEFLRVQCDKKSATGF